jgi:hypothetical protein
LPLAVDRHVQVVVGDHDVALFGDAVDRRGFDAQADLNARGHDGAGIRGIGAGAQQVLVEQVLKLRPLALEPGRVHVGDVVRDDLDIHLLGQHARCGDAKRTHMG